MLVVCESYLGSFDIGDVGFSGQFGVRKNSI
jgi:hypothetical protein